ncbi:uncharacterized protein LOC133523299 isoform X2 [Cydia pomonella]|uniref:uncharacterized protein LOC133523299 isoform X2 n=1 Tax=Cydia pomonella TaxID=82600 RepID=UPI002ADD3A1B|nr:uncharacterized protein LOC133523299 isoform X2 [Cydia pomonella]
MDAIIMLHSISKMKIAAFLLLLVNDSHNKDLLVGSTDNSTLTYMEVAYNNAEPAKSWEDDVIYFSGKVDKTIKAIKVQDLDETNEKDIAIIIAGGVAHNFVNISLKSDPGYSLNYKIEIYS